MSRRLRRGGAGRAGRAPLALALPAAAVAAAALLPLAYLVLRAATADRAAWELVPPGSTARLVLDTALLVAVVVALSSAIGVPLAWLVTRTDLPGRRAWAVAAALPLAIPSYVAALALLGALGPRGLLQGALEGLVGVERLPEIYGLPGAALALTLSTYPYVFLLAAAGLRTLDPSLEDAARALGESRLGVFRRVTLPALRPSLGAGALLVALYTMSDFGAVALMQYPALTRAVYLQYQALFDRNSAAILALVLVALTAALLALESRARRGLRVSRSSPGAGRLPAVVALGRWRWGALGFCTAVVGLFFALPVGVLVWWAARAIPLGQPVELAWQATLNSLAVSALAAAVAVACALPVAFLSQRHPRVWTRAIERLSYTSNALPGIVVALALVFFGARYGGFLYQSLGLLVFAYVIRFLPQSLAAVGSALQAVNPRIEEAARGLGRSQPAVLLTITARLARPGLLAGAALVFLSTMKELPATLLLRPIGFETLSTEIWKAATVDAYSQAAPAALLLLLAAAPLVYLLAARRTWELGAPG